MVMAEAILVPNHIGFIMDGNRRWAKERRLGLLQGHTAGYLAAKQVAEACFDRGIQYVTFYAFSTENWRRAAEEVGYLMKILAVVVSAREVKYYVKNNIRIRFLGSRHNINSKLLEGMARTEKATADLTGGTLAVCLDYGGQQEIADAAKQCVLDGLAAEQITPQAIAERLYCPDIPSLDLIVRTSGEQRLSNFMLWRAEYSELLFLQKHWPDMTKQDVTDIIEAYARRSRRFGG